MVVAAILVLHGSHNVVPPLALTKQVLSIPGIMYTSQCFFFAQDRICDDDYTKYFIVTDSLCFARLVMTITEFYRALCLDSVCRVCLNRFQV